MDRKSTGKWLSTLVIGSMLFGSAGPAFGAAMPISDVKGHWAENSITSWIQKGWIQSYEDGSFKPEQAITRAEFVTLLNRSFSFTEMAPITFSDVAKSHYAYNEVAKAVKAGYIQGYADGTFGLNQPVSRQEAAVMLNRVLGGQAVNPNVELPFADRAEIAPWAKEGVSAAVAQHILEGYGADQTLRPLANIKRSEAVVVLERALAARATHYTSAGTYGPASGTQTVNGNVVIDVPGVTLQNMVINGDLIFAAGIGSGDADLKHVTVKGKTQVQGGGENSIHMVDSILLSVLVDKSNGTVRIVAEGATTVGEVTVSSAVTIEEKGATGAGFGKVTISDHLPEGSKVTLLGSFDGVTVKSDKIKIEIPSGSVKEVLAESTAADLTLQLGQEAKIIQLILDAAAKVIGTGTIEKAVLSLAAKQASTFEKQPNKVEDKAAGGGAPTATPAPSGGGGGGGGGSPSTPQPPNNRLSILDFGAVANDGLDDLPAIKLAVDAAKAQGKSVYVPSGEFNLNGLLTLDGVDLSGDGESSVLKAMDLKFQAIILTGEGTDLSAVKLISVPASTRLTNDDSARVRVGPQATNYSIKNIVIDGGSSVGFFNAGNHGIISGNTVRNMLADGIHITALSHDILVENNTVNDVGDDLIAVVSYEKFGGWVKNVTIRNNVGSGGEARGLTVSGGENVLIENNHVKDIYGAGIYLSSEGNYKTYAVKDVIVRNNTVTNDSINGGSPTKGGFNVTATNMNPSLDNVLVENNKFIDSEDNGVLIVGTFDINGLTFKNNEIINPGNYGIMIVKTVTGTIDIAGNTVTNSGKAKYVNYSSETGITSDLPNEADNGGDTGTNTAAYGTPTIDGKADDFWAHSSVLQMDAASTGTTGTVRVAWDEDKLYYLFNVQDTTPYAVSEKEKNDSVEVWVDQLNTRNGAQTTGDYQMRVDLNNAVTTSMKTPPANFLNSVTSAVYHMEGGYSVEIAIPYTVGDHHPAAGDLIGFNGTANDDSNGDGLRDGFATWVDRNLPYWADTRVYNQVKLAAPVLPPNNRLSILDFGAVANDGLDDLPAIKLAVDAAKAQGKSVYVPSGEFNLNGLLTLDGVDLSGDGESSVLKAMDLKFQAIILTGEGTDLSAVKLISVPASTRLTNDDSARVRVGPQATNYSIKNIVIDGGSSVGFFNAGNHGIISGNTVRNMLADGIHITALSHDILVENNTVNDVGDDLIAVVSYEKFGGWVKNVTIRNNVGSGGEARGLTVSGGENVLIENNHVKDIYGAGIYLSSEGNYKTYAVKDVIVRNNTVTNDSINGGSPTKGGFNVTATNMNPSLDNVLVENNKFIDSEDNGVLIVGTFDINGLTFKNNEIINPANYGIMIVKTVTGTIDIAGNTVTNSGKAKYVNYSSETGITSDLPNEADNGGDTGTNTAAYGTPTIDGKADDFWAHSSVLQMDAASTGTTGTVRVAWDEDKLYYLFNVQDTTPYAVSEKEKNDSVEVWVDQLNTRNGAQTTGDYQMRVDLNNAVTTSMKTPPANFLNSVTSAVYHMEGGYSVEIAIPYTVGDHHPAAGDLIGFNGTANDDSNGDGLRDGFATWVDRNLPYWADTRVYNRIQLAKAKGTAAP